jgi:hypothetical protein
MTVLVRLGRGLGNPNRTKPSGAAAGRFSRSSESTQRAATKGRCSVRFTVLADFDTQDLEAAAEKVAVIQAVAKDALLVVENPEGLLFADDLRRLGVNIRAACLGHREKKLLTGAARGVKAN